MSRDNRDQRGRNRTGKSHTNCPRCVTGTCKKPANRAARRQGKLETRTAKETSC